MPPPREPTTIAIFGPTSSGKTALAVKLSLLLAERAGVEPVVVSADSRQVYRYMDIGTSKTTAEEMRGVRHEMIDVADPDRKLSLEGYVRLAGEVINGHLSGGRLPLIVGGTGTYVAALTQGWDVGGTEAARKQLARDFPPGMRADAYDTLRRLDAAAAAKVRPGNYDAILNALVRVTTGASSSSETKALVLGVDRSPAALERRVADTLDRQMHSGLVEEILQLNERYQLDEESRARGAGSENQVLRTHGYREFFDLARSSGKRIGQLTKAELVIARSMVLDHIVPHTRRQRSWFRKLPDVKRVRAADEAFRLIMKHLGR